MKKSYQINTINDLLHVPGDRREACVRGLLYGLTMHELAFGEEAQNIQIGAMTWTDDDDHSVVLHDPSGAAVLSLSITADDARGVPEGKSTNWKECIKALMEAEKDRK